MPKQHRTFTIRFTNDMFAPAIEIDRHGDPQKIIDEFGLLTPRPTIFITGGASNMSDDDIVQTRHIIEDGIAQFAQQHRVTVIDGGTEAGVMEMMGAARKKHNFNFPLIGVAPHVKVKYPNWQPPGASVSLEDAHSHFVLVDAPQWGDESQMIVNLTRAIAAKQRPMVGVLINGGKIAERDVYLATVKHDNPIPMIVLDGSGRVANTISQALRTQNTDSTMIRAIIEGGDITLVGLNEGAESLRIALEKHFKTQRTLA